MTFSFPWLQGERTLAGFFDRVNAFHPTIKFTHEWSTSIKHFWDIPMSLQKDTIQTSVFTKPTDRHTYTLFNSFHPEHTQKSILHCQALRYKPICFNTKDFQNKSDNLTLHFTLQAYPLYFIRTNIDRVNRVPRLVLLEHKRISTLT